MTTKTQLGTVTAFNSSTGRGRVQTTGGDTLEFGATSFRSGRPARYASKGDSVQVVVSVQSGTAVSVRLMRENEKK